MRDNTALGELLPYLLQRSSYLITARFHSYMKLKGVSVSRWRMLAWLLENQPYSINDLSRQLLLKQPTVTQLVDNAVRDGLLRKQADKGDGRRVLVTLTKKGHALASEFMEMAQQAEQSLELLVGEKKSRTLKAELRSLILELESI